ncbi:hypothetical protein [Streptomyces sp. MP131-18]|uniref:hypothetical protein n=1 Tax=Streptomyces sp. MP131-18 TaxID=1857892 RepID=UPI00117CBFAD|nr:hypothetical protein [Streptomyces sp. MP131-18]
MSTPQDTTYSVERADSPDDGDAWTGDDSPSYPELPSNPHNHVFTWSPKLSDGSMLVIRSNSAAGLLAATQAVAGVAAELQRTWDGAKATSQGFQQAMQQQYQNSGFNGGQQPNQPYQGQPPWQQAGAPQGGAMVPPGWMKLNVPFPQKGAFDAIVAQYNIRKGDPNNGGQVSFQKAVKSWYCAPEVAQAFAQFTPTPA